MSFERFLSRFKNYYAGYLKIKDDGEGGYVLSIRGNYIKTFRVNGPIQVYADGEGCFNSLRFVYRDSDDEYHESLAKLMKYFVCEAATVLDPDAPTWAFVDLFRSELAEGEQSLECEEGGYVFRYVCAQSEDGWDYECSFSVK